MTKRQKKKTAPPKVKTIILQEDSPLNQHMVERLENLFTMASPRTLRNSINYIFYQYLYHADDAAESLEFKHIAEDFYLIQNFFGWRRKNKSEKVSESEFIFSLALAQFLAQY
jgi:hypothetical protein